MKDEFIDAYQWEYGSTKKEARAMYARLKKENPEWIKLTIDIYINQLRKMRRDD